jgi:LL-diaminopimelate aminotransferase
MARLNHHYSKLAGNYLFAEIERRIALFQEKNPDAKLLNLGIGDFTRPLPSSVVAALLEASNEMGSAATFRGYGPAEGYSFLREAIAKYEYANLSITPDEIFISDGAQNDLAHIQEIFAMENRIAVPNPTYPGYVDINVMAGRTRLPLKGGGYGGVIYLDSTEENNFCPTPPNRPSDLIYLCSPNNPTGTALDRPTLESWVRYAKEHQAVIIFDGAYEAYVRSPNTPRSIFEIEGAREVAIEIRTFSKNAGFTGLRCSYAVVPHALKITESFQTQSLHALWKRRQNTKFGGVPYPVQRAAAAIYTEQGQREVRAIVDAHLEQARFLRKGLSQLGHIVYGGIDSPYVWMKTPNGSDSWTFFDRLLEKTHLVTIPGVGFGSGGEGYIRLSAFANPTHIAEGIERFRAL